MKNVRQMKKEIMRAAMFYCIFRDSKRYRTKMAAMQVALRVLERRVADLEAINRIQARHQRIQAIIRDTRAAPGGGG